VGLRAEDRLISLIPVGYMDVSTNERRLVPSFEKAKAALETGSSAGPYRIFAVYEVKWPEENTQQAARSWIETLNLCPGQLYEMEFQVGCIRLQESGVGRAVTNRCGFC